MAKFYSGPISLFLCLKHERTAYHPRSLYNGRGHSAGPLAHLPNTLRQQPGGAQPAHDQGAAKELRHIPQLRRCARLLPHPRIYLHRPQVTSPRPPCPRSSFPQSTGSHTSPCPLNLHSSLTLATGGLPMAGTPGDRCLFLPLMGWS